MGLFSITGSTPKLTCTDKLRTVLFFQKQLFKTVQNNKPSILDQAFDLNDKNGFEACAFDSTGILFAV